MPTLKTFTRNRYFEYKLLPDGEILVYTPGPNGQPQHQSALVLTQYTIALVKQAIADSVHHPRERIAMGAARGTPPANSLGAVLTEVRQSPQQLSYLMPILVAEGYCHMLKQGNTIYFAYNPPKPTEEDTPDTTLSDNLAIVIADAVTYHEQPLPTPDSTPTQVELPPAPIVPE